MKITLAVALTALINCFLPRNEIQAFDAPVDMKNVCDHPLSPHETKLVDATAMLVQIGRISQNPDLTYNIQTGTLTNISSLGEDPIPLCDYSMLHGETTGVAGRTGFLIGPDMIMTAPHTANFNPQQFAVVFRTRVQDQNQNACVNFDWNNVPADNVFFPSSNTTVSNSFQQNGAYDYAVFKLDRPATGRMPLKIRRSGKPQSNSIVIMTGFPARTGMKIDTAGLLTEPATTPELGHLFNNLHPLNGSSGSPIYNPDDDTVEAVVAKSISGAFTYDTDSNPNCVYLVSSGLEKATNSDISAITGQIPRSEVLASPQDKITHNIPIPKSPILLPPVVYTLRSGLNSNQYNLSLSDDMGGNSPALFTSINPGNHLLSLFNPTYLTVTPSVNGNISCGVWEQSVNIHDNHFNQDNFLRHRFEIGLKEVEISPTEEFLVQSLDGPYIQTKQYTLKNLRPSSTTIYLTTSIQNGSLNQKNSWLKLNGKNNLYVTLGPAGSRTSEYSIIASIDPNFETLVPAHEWENAIIIARHKDLVCAIQDDIEIPARARWGRAEFLNFSSGDVLFPPINNTTDISIDVENDTGLCVTDLNFDYGQVFDERINVASSLIETAQYLRIEVFAPSGKSAVLWNTNALPLPLNKYVQNEVLDGFFGIEDLHTQILRLDDQINPPLAGKLLNHFNGEPVNGTWTIRLSRGSGNGTMMPTHARLDITASNNDLECAQYD